MPGETDVFPVSTSEPRSPSLQPSARLGEVPAVSVGDQTTINAGRRNSHRLDEVKRQSNQWAGPRIIQLVPGVILMAILGLIAFGLAQIHASLDALTIAVLLGIAVRGMLGSAAQFTMGVQACIKLFIPAGIIIYAVGLDLSMLSVLTIPVVLLVFLIIFGFYGLVGVFNRFWKVPRNTGFLVASGSASCGAPAILVLTPGAEAEPEDTSVSILVVTVIGLIGALTYPILRDVLNLPDKMYAIFSGSTLSQPGLVQMAVAAMEPEVVNLALGAMAVRILVLLVLAVGFGVFRERSRRDYSTISASKKVWFLAPFIFFIMLVTIFPGLREVLAPVRALGTYTLALASASIGFSMNMDRVMNLGSRPLWSGLVAWLTLILLILVIWPIFR